MLTMLLMLGVAGCGHKSDAELVDIEQFRCQDSIQTVFDELGSVQIENDSYKYENLNLWGYDGTATFTVREDEDTIKEFHCDLVLDKKEFEEVLSSLSEKYGSYQEKDYGSSKTSYKWITGEETYETGYEEGEVGFDEIEITFDGEENYQIVFRDEWSDRADELYSVYTDEPEEDDYTVRAEVDYDVCGDSLNLKIINRNGKHELICYGTVKSKLNANIMLALLFDTCEGIKTSFNGYTVGVTREDGGSAIITWDGNDYLTSGINEDGSVSLTLPDWYTDDELMSDSEFVPYATAYENAWEKLATELQNNLD